MTPVTAKGIKALVGKSVTKQVPFNGDTVTIRKLTVGEVFRVQGAAQEGQKKADAGQVNELEHSMNMLKLVIGTAVEGGDQLTDEDYQGFPMDELTNLSNAVMQFSGIMGEEAGKSS